RAAGVGDRRRHQAAQHLDLHEGHHRRPGHGDRRQPPERHGAPGRTAEHSTAGARAGRAPRRAARHELARRGQGVLPIRDDGARHHARGRARGGGPMTAPAFLITGATGQLGATVVEQLAGRGDRLLLVARDKDRLADLEAELGLEGKVETVVADVSDTEDARRAAGEAVSRFGRLDGLVHLVGGFHAGPLFLTAPDVYERMLRDNFLSAVTATQGVLPHLGEGGRLVYFGTPLADVPLPGLSAYAAAK